MNPEELAAALAAAERAIAAGKSPIRVGAVFRDKTGVSFTDAQKQIAKAAAPEQPRIRRGMAALTSLIHGATIGQLPNIATAGAARAAGQLEAAGLDSEAVDVAGTRDRVRGDVQAAREEFPVQSLAAEVGGGLLGGAATAPLTAPMAPAATGARMAAGAATGGAVGGSFAHGEGGDIPTGVGIGATIGGLIPGAVPAARRLASWVRGSPTGERIGQAARRAGEQAGARPFSEAREVASDLRSAASDLYKKLDSVAEVTDANVLESVRGRFARYAQPIAADVVDGTRAPTGTEIQAIRNRIRGLMNKADRSGRTDLVQRHRAALAEFDRIAGEALPDLGEANRLYRSASQIEDGLKQGRRMLNASADDIRIALTESSPEYARALREGYVDRLTTRLEQRQNAPALLKKFQDAGPETRAALEMIFGDAAEEFLEVAAEGKPSAITQWLGRHKLGAGIATGVAIAETGRRTLGGLLD